jgi:hypothetical protein
MGGHGVRFIVLIDTVCADEIVFADALKWKGSSERPGCPYVVYGFDRQ